MFSRLRFSPSPLGEGRGEGSPFCAAPGTVTSTFAPSRMRSTPSVITRSPACTPDSIAVRVPSVGPVVTGRMATVLSSFTTYTMVPCEPRWIAADGTATTPLRVSTTMRTFTNWLGKSLPSLLGNCAFSRTVPVVTSIWLSVVMSAPLASRFFCSRSHASTGGFSPAFSRASTRGSVSWGMVNSTPIGSTCVMTAMPAASEPRTMLPASTVRSPRRPDIGAVMRV